MNNIEIVTAWNSTQNTNSVTDIKKLNKRSITHNNSKEKNDPSRKRVSRNSKKKRPKKKKKKITSKQNESPILDITNDDSFSTPKNVPKNPYRKFLLYKLRKKYDAKAYIYDLKKVNELIFNIPSHFTATFKEYLLKEEEAEFLKRIYLKNELNKKLRNVFYFYEKYSKIFPNYIVIPEGHYLYKNILKKQKMIDKLQNTYNSLKIEFSNVFKKLFRGGEASLILTNPSDILTSGLDIKAVPPGKDIKSTKLLSGGESTLTAIALLFAVLNIRTVPFCIFDDVEAALDEANVDMFGQYLNKLNSDTQFIIITHKKRTMEYTNNLYGITMQESGVSKLVSVKLD